MAIIPEMSVPRRAIPVFTWLGTLPQEEYDALFAALSGLEEKVASQEDLTAGFEGAVKSTDARQSRELVSIILSLRALHDSHDWDIDSIAETAAADKNLKLDDDQRSKVRRWLHASLTNPSISRIATIEDVHDEYQAVFHTVRVLTDLRPVFSDEDSEDQPDGMLVTHTIKVTYGTLEGIREIYLALDENDLETIENAVIKAKKQGRQLRNLLKSANVSELTPTHE